MMNRSSSHGKRGRARRAGLRPGIILFALLFFLPLAAEGAKKSYRYEDDPVRLGMKAIETGDYEAAEARFNEAIENEHQTYRARYGLGELLRLRGSYAEAEPLFRRAIMEKNQETGNADYPEAHAALGLVLLRLDRLEEAKQELEQAQKEDGGSWQAHYGLARIALLEDRLGDAEKHLERGKKRKGVEQGEDLYRYGMALLQRKRGEIAEAEKNALAALHINPNDPLYGTLVGEVYTERGAPTLAIMEFEKVLHQPGLLVRAPVHHDLGSLYERERRFNDALDQYHEAVRKDSTYAPAWKSMAELYALADRSREAAQTYLRYTELRPDDWEGYLGLAQAALAADLRQPALDAATQAFSLDSTRVEIRLALARATFLNNDKQTAERLYESLPDTVALEALDLVRVGQLKLDRNDLDEAARSLRQAIEMDSTQSDAFFALGLLELRQGAGDSAVVQFERAIAVNPRHSAAQLNLGVAWLQMQKPCNAITPLRTAVGAAPGYTQARVYLAMSLVNCSEDSLSAAVAEYRVAIEQEPQNATALRGLGFCYLKRGDCGAARDVLRPATTAAADNADGWAMLGQAQAICGDLEGAARSFRRAIEISPAHPTATQGLQTIEAQPQ